MITIVINGQNYDYPQVGDTEWGDAATTAMQALATTTLQPVKDLNDPTAVNNFTLYNDINFGNTNGLRVLFVESNSNNPALSGVFRLCNGELVAWRNGNNDNDNSISFDASDNFVINGNTISFDVDGEMLVNGVQVTRSGEIVNADVADSAGIVESKLSLDYSTQSLYDNIENHKADTNNPHSVTKSQVLTGDLIVNSDVDDSAGIVESKLSLDYGTTALNTNIENHKADTSNPHDTKISNLDDVTITSVQDKNILAYDSNDSLWKNITNSVNNLDGVSVTTPAAGQVLTYDGSNWTNQPSASASLAGLTDTTITTPVNGDTLLYNSVSTKWENSNKLTTVDTNLTSHTTNTSNPHSTTVSNLDDTTITTPSDQDTIVYDNVSSKWINQENSLDNLSNTDIDSNTVAENDVMVYDDVNQKWINSPILVNHIGNASNPHLTTISKLTDTTITTPSDKQLLQYDYANLQWVNSSDVWSTIEVNDIANINSATTNITLTSSDKRHQIFTATDGFNITLPSSNIKTGDKFIFDWSSDFNLTITNPFSFYVGSTIFVNAWTSDFTYIFISKTNNPSTTSDWFFKYIPRNTHIYSGYDSATVSFTSGVFKEADLGGTIMNIPVGYHDLNIYYICAVPTGTGYGGYVRTWIASSGNTSGVADICGGWSSSHYMTNMPMGVNSDFQATPLFKTVLCRNLVRNGAVKGRYGFTPNGTGNYTLSWNASAKLVAPVTDPSLTII